MKLISQTIHIIITRSTATGVIIGVKNFFLTENEIVRNK